MVEPGIGGSITFFCLHWPTREVVELYQLLYLGTANVMSSDPPCRNGKAGFTQRYPQFVLHFYTNFNHNSFLKVNKSKSDVL